jgi:DNA-binding response OmpR family regulator
MNDTPTPLAAGSGRVLIAEDDGELRALIGFALRNAGFEVLAASDGTSALEIFATQPVSLLILDIMMPGADGFAVCQAVRARSSVPVIMLSARTNENDIVRALQLGADDYLTKPFSPRTLLARIQALLRRVEPPAETLLESAGVALDVQSHVLRHGSKELHLTPLETLLLRALMRSPGRTVSTERLVSEAWGRSGAEERHALKQVIYRLRRKLESSTTIADRLHTLRNAGYRWSGGDERGAVAPNSV